MIKIMFMVRSSPSVGDHKVDMVCVYSIDVCCIITIAQRQKISLKIFLCLLVRTVQKCLKALWDGKSVFLNFALADNIEVNSR